MSVTAITSTHPLLPDLREAWRYRYICVMLAHRNLKIRYMQTLLGSVWLVLQPLLQTGMLTLVMGMLLAVPSDGLLYSLFVFTGMTMWTAFQRALNDTGMS